VEAGEETDSRKMRMFVWSVLPAMFWSMAIFGAADARERVLTVALAGSVSTFDPHASTSAPDLALAAHRFDALITRQHEQLAPQLAESWKKGDGDSWDFVLRRDVRFHDGRPLRARDVVFSLCRLKESANGQRLIPAVNGAEALDDLTVRVRTASLEQFDLDDLTLAFVTAAPPDGGEFNPGSCGTPDSLIGTGPYRLLPGSTVDRMELARVDSPWHGDPPWDRLVLMTVLDQFERVRMLREGLVDVADAPPPEALDYLKDRPDLTVVTAKSDRTISLAFSMAAAVPDETGSRVSNPFCDGNARRAVAGILDSASMSRRLFRGHYRAASQLVPSGVIGHVTGRPVPAADRETARRMLEVAGFADGLKTRLVYRQDARIDMRPVTVLASGSLSEIGIKAELEPRSRTEFQIGRRAGAFPLMVLRQGFHPVSVTQQAELLTSMLPQGPQPVCPGITDEIARLQALARTVDQRLVQRESADSELAAFADGVARLAILIPLIHEQSLVALRSGLEYQPVNSLYVFGRHVILRPDTAEFHGPENR
jgi:peptide/nickel transport system substrate-binding protein